MSDPALLTLSQISSLFEALAAQYQDAQIELNYHTPYQLLIAVVLSAQSTDRSVNKVTHTLFETLKKPQDMSLYTLEEIQGKIATLGLFKQKAYALQTLSQQLIVRHHGVIPESFSDLIALQGVGRKTAHVVLNELYGHPVIAVDTHVYRVSRRLGLSHSIHRDHVGDDLHRVVPELYRKRAHHYLIFLGRRLCHSRTPQCGQCFLSAHCAYYQAQSLHSSQ